MCAESSPRTASAVRDLPGRVGPVRVRRRLPAPAWPRRRWVTAAALTPPLAALYWVAGRGGQAWWSAPAALACAASAALILASYLPLPGSGRRLALGCTPCAAASGAAVVCSLLLRDRSPAEVGPTLTAGLLLVVGLGQRLGTAGSCAIPAGRGPGPGPGPVARGTDSPGTG